MQIAGVAIVLFCGVLVGVGIHHLIATGTCSSTGYSANYGPVPTCPAGTGWWIAFLFVGIIGGLIGSAMAASLALVFAGTFSAIGFGSLSLLLDSNTQTREKILAAVFGGFFALGGVGAGIGALRSSLGSLRSAPARPTFPSTVAPASSSTFAAPQAPASAFGAPEASAAFGGASTSADPIMSAYQATSVGAANAPPPSPVGAAGQARPAASSDAIDEIAKLADLHQRGALTDAEFDKAKANLLGRM